ncbi:hypothetical protein A4A49_51713 [Nicotiana attenuata]|uniref:Uncharacterized protein n=1 Tax=Nicotiana attenuata TaxID=49451 RepID=A0A314KWE7_NICAT|nr:hypothetical protein A4A49_51713 [Nicotiana attenuata]
MILLSDNSIVKVLKKHNYEGQSITHAPWKNIIVNYEAIKNIIGLQEIVVCFFIVFPYYFIIRISITFICSKK